MHGLKGMGGRHGIGHMGPAGYLPPTMGMQAPPDAAAMGQVLTVLYRRLASVNADPTKLHMLAVRVAKYVKHCSRLRSLYTPQKILSCALCHMQHVEGDVAVDR